MPEPRRAADTPRTEYPAYRKLPWGKWLSMMGIVGSLIGGGAWLMSACSDHEGRHVRTEETQQRILKEVDRLGAATEELNKTLVLIRVRLGPVIE